MTVVPLVIQELYCGGEAGKIKHIVTLCLQWV